MNRANRFGVLGLLWTMGLSLIAQKTGLGTMTPAARFHIHVPTSYSDSLFKVSIGNRTIFIISPQGKVGVNVPVPLETFHMKGIVRITSLSAGSGNPDNIIVTDANGVLSGFQSSGQATDVLRGDLTWGSPGSSLPLWFDAGQYIYPSTLSGGKQFAITDSARVGVGTFNPRYPLHVVGPIWQTNTGQSILIGEYAGGSDNLANNKNVYMGAHAGSANISGIINVAVGPFALNGGNNISSNVAVGNLSVNISSGVGNVGIGEAAINSRTASYNVALGSYILSLCDSCTFNVGIGAGALLFSNNAHKNVAVGTNALAVNDFMSRQVAIGSDALSNAVFSLFGGGSLAIGDSALALQQQFTTNTAIGFKALKSSTSSVDNTAVGYMTLKQNTTGKGNTAIGTYTLENLINANYNTAIGTSAMRSLASGSRNTSVGYNSLLSSSTDSNNIAIGHESMRFAQASFSIALGTEALKNANGMHNVAIGSFALNQTTTGQENVAIGFRSLEANTTGTGNVAIGQNSMKNSQVGSYNVAVGSHVLFYANSNYNTAIGTQALYLQKKPEHSYGNTAIGYQSIYFSDSLTVYNVAIGDKALYTDPVNKAKRFNVAIGAGSMLTTTPSTTDTSELSYNVVILNQPYNTALNKFQRNTIVGFYTGGVSQVTQAVLIGESSVPDAELSAIDPFVIGIGNDIGYKTSSGSSTMSSGIAVGHKTKLVAKDDISTGAGSSNSVRIGYSAGYDARDSAHHEQVVAIGSRAMTSRHAVYGMAIGSKAFAQDSLFIADTIHQSVAIGFKAGYNVKSPSGGIVIGSQALASQSLPGPELYKSVVIGGQAMFPANQVKVYSSVVIGRLSGYAVSIGNDFLRNVFIGFMAGTDSIPHFDPVTDNVVIGYKSRAISEKQSVIIGYKAGKNINSGYENVFIGSEAGIQATTTDTVAKTVAVGAYSGPTGPFNNTGALGYRAQPTASNRYHFGNTSVNWIGGNVNLTVGSDRKIKRKVSEDVPGLKFIMGLKPATYNLDIDTQQLILYGSVDTATWRGKYDIEQIRFSGFIAQEVDSLIKAISFDFSGLQSPESKRGDGKAYTISYSSFVVPLVKAIQEQQEILKKQKNKIQANQQRLSELIRDLIEAQQEIKELENQLDQIQGQ